MTAALGYNASTNDYEVVKERVLVFPANVLEPFLPLFREGIINNHSQAFNDCLNAVMDPSVLAYMDRGLAEKDPNFKQLIPYTCIFLGKHLFYYQRTKKGGDSRLHDLWSIGVGGHINPVDGKGGRETYWAAFNRELAEEVSLEKVPAAPIKGLIYDASNDVGKVHFGVVHFLSLSAVTEIKFNDPALANGHSQHVLDIKRNPGCEFENWSKLVIKHLL